MNKHCHNELFLTSITMHIMAWKQSIASLLVSTTQLWSFTNPMWHSGTLCLH